MAELQYWSASTRGGYFTNNRLSEQLRYATQPICKFRQFCDIRQAWGKGVGDTVYFNKISRISTAGAALTETDEIPEHKFAISRGTITVTEYGNSIPYTGKLEALGQFDVANPITRVLRDDQASVLDKAAGLQFKLTQRKYTMSATNKGVWETLDGAAETLASAHNHKSQFQVYHLKEIVDKLKQNNIPKFDGENYVCIGSVNLLRGLKDDGEWQEAVKYGDPERLFSGEIGRMYGCRFIEETNYLNDTLGTATNYGEGVIFGAEAVIEGVAVPEELRAKVPTDYGRSKGVAWYGILGWEKMWKRLDSGQEAHIVHITSLT